MSAATKIIVGGAIAGVLYLVATRTCFGRKLVARVRGLELTACGCGCTGHDESVAPSSSDGSDDPPSRTLEPAFASLVSLDKESSYVGPNVPGCAGCGGDSPVAQTARAIAAGAGRTIGGVIGNDEKPAPQPLPMLREDIAAGMARVRQMLALPVSQKGVG